MKQGSTQWISQIEEVNDSIESVVPTWSVTINDIKKKSTKMFNRRWLLLCQIYSNIKIQNNMTDAILTG
jgi:hypothetical protein